MSSYLSRYSTHCPLAERVLFASLSRCWFDWFGAGILLVYARFRSQFGNVV